MAIFKKAMWRIDADTENRLYGNIMNIVTVYPDEDSDEDDCYEVCIVVPTPLFKWFKDERGLDSDTEISLYLECEFEGKYVFGYQYSLGNGETRFDDLWVYRGLPSWAEEKY